LLQTSQYIFLLKIGSPQDLQKDLGLEPIELYVHSLIKDYHAEQATLLKHDRLYSIENQKV